MATPMRLRRGSAVVGAACSRLLFSIKSVRMPQASSPPRTPAGHPARLGELGTTWAAMIAAALAASVLPAQAQFTSITGFGDSYADTGTAPGGAFRLLGIPCPNDFPLPTCRFTGSTNFVDSLQSIYGLPGLTNYAIGGARTYNSNTLQGLSEGFPYEVQQLASTERTSPIPTSSRCPSAATTCRP